MSSLSGHHFACVIGRQHHLETAASPRQPRPKTSSNPAAYEGKSSAAHMYFCILSSASSFINSYFHLQLSSKGNDLEKELFAIVAGPTRAISFVDLSIRISTESHRLFHHPTHSRATSVYPHSTIYEVQYRKRIELSDLGSCLKAAHRRLDGATRQFVSGGEQHVFLEHDVCR